MESTRVGCLRQSASSLAEAALPSTMGIGLVEAKAHVKSNEHSRDKGSLREYGNLLCLGAVSDYVGLPCKGQQRYLSQGKGGPGETQGAIAA